ncbi:class I SAM-dependent methyltransferase [Campylobacter concisus]|uniref:class I SAM-dependent methyltransferase n=1 Tax=Campylobacter concisus TaxID=199 RepID=UPI000D2FBDB0|nr:class I SAM-dependent methyltransferase [Campylobacter concisus]
MQNLWDKKASNYQRFDGKVSAIQQQIFAKALCWGVDFSGKEILDIGCGTGVWTIFLSKTAKNITGIDSSKNMIEILNEDAKRFGVTNLTSEVCSWREFKPAKRFDIAICTMSPAIASDEDFAKFHSIAKQKLYLGWDKPRSSDLLEPFFKKFGRTLSQKNVVNRLEAWLNKQGIAYKSEILNETRIARRSVQEAAENICWHLEINGAKNYDEKVVLAILKERFDGEFIDEKIESQMKLFVF